MASKQDAKLARSASARRIGEDIIGLFDGETALLWLATATPDRMHGIL